MFRRRSRSGGRPRTWPASPGDPSNAPEWHENIQSAGWQTDPPLQVGSRVAFIARFLGRRLACTYEITGHEPGLRLVTRTAQGPFPMQTTYTWTDAGDGSTRMSLRNQGEPAGFPALAAPLVTVAMRRAGRKDLARLRSILEQAQTRPGAG